MLCVLAGTILFGTSNLRQRIRAQMISREAELMHSIALMQYVPDPTAPGGEVTEPLDAALEVSRLPHKGVLGVRLFDAQGRFQDAFPAHVTEGELGESEAGAAKALRSLGTFEDGVQLGDYFLVAPTVAPGSARGFALLKLTVPLHREHEGRLLGIAQFLLEGESLKREFAALDRSLVRQAGVAFLVSGGVAGLGLAWALRRLTATQRALEHRTASLLRANHDLTLAAKTSAVGAVTAHLIHGLKNPLSGLQQFVTDAGRDPAGGNAEDWRDAAAAAGRMQSLVSDVVRVLQEQNAQVGYEVALEELAQILDSKVRPLAQNAGLGYESRQRGTAVLSNQEANIVLLVLENLLQNAVQATPGGKRLELEIEARENAIRFSVRDQGNGLPEEIRTGLFSPCRSSKPGGSGLGLAISHQLARHIGGELTLVSSGPEGSVFCLEIRRRGETQPHE